MKSAFKYLPRLCSNYTGQEMTVSKSASLCKNNSKKTAVQNLFVLQIDTELVGKICGL